MATMITSFKFDDTNDLLRFLSYHAIIGTWEVQLARVSAVGGLTMELNTQKTNYQGQTVYLSYNNIKNMINAFIEDNKYMSINIELKFRYPDKLRNIMDIYNKYSVFWLNCYSDSVNANTYMSISYLENTPDLATDPITNWAVYIHSLYNDYQNNKSTIV